MLHYHSMYDSMWGGVKNTKTKYFSDTFIAHKLKSNSYRLLILFKIGIFIPSTDFSNLHDTSHTVDKNLLRKLVFLKTVIQWQIFCSYPVQWKMSSIYKQKKKNPTSLSLNNQLTKNIALSVMSMYSTLLT